MSVALSSSSDCRLVSFLIFDIGDNPIIRERNSGAEVSQDYNFHAFWKLSKATDLIKKTTIPLN